MANLELQAGEVGEFTPTDLTIGVIGFLLVIVTASLAFVAARRFAGGLATGTILVGIGVIFAEISFILGIADHRVIAGQTSSLAHPTWVHLTTILLGFLFFMFGFIAIYRTAVKVAKER